MAILHRSQDISTHPKFHKKLFHHKLLMLEDPWMPIFEYSTGLHFNEFNEATDCSENHIPLQRHMADPIKELHFAFIPTKSVLEDMYELFERNNIAAPNCRVPFYTVQSLENCHCDRTHLPLPSTSSLHHHCPPLRHHLPSTRIHLRKAVFDQDPNGAPSCGGHPEESVYMVVVHPSAG
ncbi:hypothetical protein CYLTODRAFT_458515 [Cylindrobasidium torrendii FP15055 ss-10]|uniref:Uncharacterized protein n=1 Tax=Cylindrobasidium torrendii FP15055 ss-10 TaxID=1314674 RepID=A0A0D7AX99_9AGAR|nr:hypothetical protein CYLTODRAFT_458515 [Cylindrobasidium torrendii FP15055 ss-10]